MRKVLLVALVVLAPARLLAGEPVPSEKRPSDAPPPPRRDAEPIPADPVPTPEPRPAVAPVAPAAPPPAARPSARRRDPLGTWPAAAIDRPLTPARGMVWVTAAGYVDLTKEIPEDPFPDPIALIPSAAYGITDRTSIGLNHRVGLCLTGLPMCSHIYDDFGVELLAAVYRDDRLELVLRANPVVQRIRDPFTADLVLGVEGRLRHGRFAVEGSAFANIALTSEVNATALGGTLRPQWQISPWLLAYLLTGFTAPAADLFVEYRVPLGAGLVYTSRRFDIGVQFAFPNLLGVNTLGSFGLSHADIRDLTITAAARF